MYTVPMKTMRVLTVLAAAFLLIALVNGAIVHALVPHSHAHSSEIAWAQLHDSLRHEDKKAILFALALSLIGSVSLLVLSHVARGALHVPVIDDRFRALSRGIYAYRRFG